MSTYSPTANQKEKAKNSNKSALAKTATSSWLAWQCQMVSGIIRGAVFSPEQIQLGTSLSLWPAEGHAEPQLVAAASQAAKSNSNVQFSKIGYGPNNQRICDVIACPILKDGVVTAIASIAFSVRSEPQQLAVLQILQWGGLWLDTLLDQQNNSAEQQHEYALALSTSVANQNSVIAASIEAVNKLAKGAACDRVSLGLRKGMKTRLKAISNTSRFDRRSHLVRQIEAAMEESSDQKSIISFPTSKQVTLIDSAHATLRENEGHQYILTIPMYANNNAMGALTFERDGKLPFDQPTILFLNSITRLLSTTLTHKLLLEKPFISRLATSLYNGVSTLLGKKHFLLKAMVIAVAATIYYAYTTNSTYKIGAPSSIEGSVRQLVAAPMDGFIKTANFRAGDRVSTGELLALFDDRKLQLQQKKFESEKRQITQQYYQALAAQDRTEMSKLRAQIGQLNSELELVDVQLQRTSIAAPFDGVVVSGDLSQALGAPVELGQVLFEIAPLESYRVILEVPERDISHLEIGQSGHLIITALPNNKFDLKVDTISPLASSNASGNYFKVEASLNEHSDLLLPGMRGVAKINTTDKSLWWIWTHRLIDKVSLFIWSMGWR